MNPERWKRIDELLSAVLDLDVDKRAAFLEDACVGDEQLRKEVETLLASDKKDQRRIEAYPIELAAHLLAKHRPILASGKFIGPYKILSLLGAGGMGEVYRAKDTRLGREVAIKILPAQLSENRDRLARFEQEARSASALNHPNIITIYDIGSFESGIYIAMELVEGKTLRHILNSGRIPLPKSMQIAGQMAEGLSKAHEAGIVHRDLKPENLIISKDGFAKILDFGLAKVSFFKPEEASNLPTHAQTEPGIILGTAPYMSPEQARGQPVDFRSDQFSFGTILYEIITGTNPFQRKTTVDSLSAIINEEPKPVSSLNPQVPLPLQWIIQRCMAKDPDDRYGSTRDLAKDLQNVRIHTSDAVSSAPSASESERLRSIKRIAPLLVISIVVALALVAVLTGNIRSRFLTKSEIGKIDSLAVLPLENLSADPEQEYFTDGMTEALISELAKIRSLKVISRTSVMQYKKSKKSLQVVAKELNVDGIVEGSVLRAGQKVRITAQLVDAHSDQHLWAESYEGTLSDVLALQSEVARAIASEIRIGLTPEEKTTLMVVKKVNPESNEAYLKGVYCFYEGLNHPSFKRFEELLRKSFDYFDRAIKIDPQNARAYAALAGSYEWYASGDHPEYYSKSKAAALKALELDDTLAEAHATLGYLLWNYDWDWAGAEREFKRAIQLNPSLSRHGYALYLSAAGRHSEAIEEIKKAEELEPMVLVVKEAVAKIYINARKYDQAVEQLQNLLRLTPNDPQFRARLAYVYYCKGMYQKAIPEFKWSIEKSAESPDPKAEFTFYLALTYAESGNVSEAVKILNQLKSSTNWMASYWIAGIYAALGEKDEAIDWLEKAFQRRAINLYIKVVPHFDGLRSDPRFQDLTRRMGIP